VGGLVLATVTILGGIAPVLTWAALGLLGADRFLTPGYKSRKNEVTTATMETKQKRTRKAAVMLKSVIRELAKAAPITVLLNTVGIGALSL